MPPIPTTTTRSLDFMNRTKFGGVSRHQASKKFPLRMREVGILKSTPQQIIAQGTDWRFLNELKKELKA